MTAIPAIFDNSAVNVFYDQVRALDTSQDVKLDASQAAKISTLAVQILISLEKSAQQSGHKLIIENATKDFCEFISDLGMDDALVRWGCR